MKKLSHLVLILFFGLMSQVFAAVSLNQKVDFKEALVDGLTGKTMKLSDFGKKAMVLEWFNDGCPFVKKHYESSNMQELQAKAAKLGFTWVIVNSSAKDKQGHLADQAAVSKIVGEWKMKPTAVFLDHEGKLGKYFGAKVTPHMFIINENSEVVYMGAIDSIKSADKADVHSKKVEKFFEIALDAVAQKKPVVKAVTNEYGCGVKYL
jgi:hypothetical protein